MNKFLITFFTFGILFCSCNIPFDVNKWNEKEDTFFKYRKQMVLDLVKNHLNTTQNKAKIIELLGEPIYSDGSLIEKGEFGYEIYEDYGWDIDPVERQFLTMTFNKDSTIDKIFLKTWKHHKGIKIKELKIK